MQTQGYEAKPVQSRRFDSPLLKKGIPEAKENPWAGTWRMDELTSKDDKKSRPDQKNHQIKAYGREKDWEAPRGEQSNMGRWSWQWWGPVGLVGKVSVFQIS
jgi:hypothetical protein